MKKPQGVREYEMYRCHMLASVFVLAHNCKLI